MAGPKKVLYVGNTLFSRKNVILFTPWSPWTSSLGGLAEEVDDKVIKSAFIPFGEISEVQIPLDYETEKHRGFAFVEFELPEDAKAAMDNMVRFEFLDVRKFAFVTTLLCLFLFLSGQFWTFWSDFKSKPC